MKNILRSKLRIAVSAVAIMLGAYPALATIDNTVTVQGTAPGGPANGVVVTADENVDVVDAGPQIAVVRNWVFAPGGDVDNDGNADAGDSIIYTYVVTNGGNVTLQTVSLSDVHDGVGAPYTIVPPTGVTTDNGSAPAGTLGDSTDTNTTDATWERLGPGDVITFTSTAYVVQPGDFTAPTSSDNDIDGTATTQGIFNPGPNQQTESSTGSASVPLIMAPSLQVAKLADDVTEVTAGQTITYTYTVTNNGNVPITAITLADTHNGIAGALTPVFQSFTTNTGSTNTGNTINVLQPGDVAEYQATYVVTQADVDSRQ